MAAYKHYMELKYTRRQFKEVGFFSTEGAKSKMEDKVRTFGSFRAFAVTYWYN